MKKIILITVLMLVILFGTTAIGSTYSQDIVIVADGGFKSLSTQYCDMMQSYAVKEQIFVEEKEEGPDDPQYGCISGSVHGSDGWATFPLPFALVTAGGKSDFTNIFGNYIIHDLPLDVSLQVTASKSGWQSQSHQVTLTAEDPMQVIHFVLIEDDSGGGGFEVYYQQYLDYLECLVRSTSMGNGDGIK